MNFLLIFHMQEFVVCVCVHAHEFIWRLQWILLIYFVSSSLQSYQWQLILFKCKIKWENISLDITKTQLHCLKEQIIIQFKTMVFVESSFLYCLPVLLKPVPIMLHHIFKQATIFSWLVLRNSIVEILLYNCPPSLKLLDKQISSMPKVD